MSEGFMLRVRYAKRGRLAFLSHLETIRSVERIIRRAQLPYAVTEGFNPHMKIAFGPALPVGAGSEGEYVDVRLKDFVAPPEALARLQAAAPANLFPLACHYIGTRAKAITVEFPLSVWEARFACDAPETLVSLQEALDALVERGFIEVSRKRKKTKRVDFADRLVEPPCCELHEGLVLVRFTTRDTGQGALRPDKFLDAALETMQSRPQLLKLTRIELRQEPS